MGTMCQALLCMPARESTYPIRLDRHPRMHLNIWRAHCAVFALGLRPDTHTHTQYTKHTHTYKTNKHINILYHPRQAFSSTCCIAGERSLPGANCFSDSWKRAPETQHLWAMWYCVPDVHMDGILLSGNLKIPGKSLCTKLNNNIFTYQAFFHCNYIKITWLTFFSGILKRLKFSSAWFPTYVVDIFILLRVCKLV